MSDKADLMPINGSSRARIDAHAASFAEHAKTIELAKDLSSLNDFIFNLCEDPTQVALYRKNPGEVLQTAGISPDLAALVQAGQSYIFGKFGDVSAAGGGDNTVTVVVVVVVVV